MASHPITRRVNDRTLYIALALLVPIVVLIGFARTYYLKGFFATPPLPSRLIHFHGIVMTAWVLLFATQVGLVAARRTKTHQRLGIAGSILALLVFVVGMLTGIQSAARGATSGPPALQFLIIPFGDMLIFATLVGLALYYRRKPHVHKRLMLLAAVNVLTPAIARIPLSFIYNNGPLAFFGLTDLVLLVCIAFDTIKHKRLHPVLLWGGIILIALQPLRLLLSGTTLWLSFAETLVRLFG